MRLCEITTKFVGFIPQSLVLKSIVSKMVYLDYSMIDKWIGDLDKV